MSGTNSFFESFYEEIVANAHIDTDDSDSDESCDIPATEKDPVYVANMMEAKKAVARIKVPTEPIAVAERPIGSTLEVQAFDASNNILDKMVMDAFMKGIDVSESDVMTAPIITTITLGGNIANVNFIESEFIERIHADEDCVKLTCNYGETVYGGYVMPPPVVKSNKGRKKKVPKNTNRKKQGNGTDFNSQITFMMRSRTVEVAPGGIVPDDTKLYKFKVFRNGKIQMPGAKQGSIADVVECAKIIVTKLNQILHPNERDPSKVCQLINLNPVMKNYKFSLKLARGEVIDLDMLREVFSAYADKESLPPGSSDCPVHPDFFPPKAGRKTTTAAIIFKTPSQTKINKKLRVNVFPSGKVNILGGFNDINTQQICKFVEWVFKKNYTHVIAYHGRCKIVCNIPPPEDELCISENAVSVELPPFARIMV